MALPAEGAAHGTGRATRRESERLTVDGLARFVLHESSQSLRRRAGPRLIAARSAPAAAATPSGAGPHGATAQCLYEGCRDEESKLR